MIRQAQGRQGVAKRGDIADYRPPAFRRHALRRSRSDCRVKTDATEQYYTPPTSGVAAGTMVGGGPTSKVYVRWLFTTAFASTPGATRTTIGTPNAMAIGASLTETPAPGLLGPGRCVVRDVAIDSRMATRKRLQQQGAPPPRWPVDRQPPDRAQRPCRSGIRVDRQRSQHHGCAARRPDRRIRVATPRTAQWTVRTQETPSGSFPD